MPSGIFPVDNIDAIPKISVETELDNGDVVLVLVDGVWKQVTLQLLAEAVEDFLV